ncbi:1-phosphatidylinositol-4-phosphate 5-kinase [Sugiyamaella lignohabitans]|uniref:1-phosphatidylinositol-4-phosphate 5-kinase n=1 Tax=Sugiyamaella lignohabitans TaxID=796027 RepID=A0A167ECG6_9ASCO|nr:1-phosphatidylinositol-4-phosphate 5-kinase [Sugiyamaella lignohabitans]ANB13904.1 1-phosphatidylinositol-4-phosphate 5-kinase [Sugiyamaella lignohabitans]
MGLRKLCRKFRHPFERDESVITTHHSFNDGVVASKSMPPDHLRTRQNSSVEGIRSSYPNCQAFLAKYGTKDQAPRDNSRIGIIENPRNSYPNCEKLAYYSKRSACGNLAQTGSTSRPYRHKDFDLIKTPQSPTGSIDSKKTLNPETFWPTTVVNHLIFEQNGYEEFIAKGMNSDLGTKGNNSEFEMDSTHSSGAENLHLIWSTPSQVSLVTVDQSSTSSVSTVCSEEIVHQNVSQITEQVIKASNASDSLDSEETLHSLVNHGDKPVCEVVTMPSNNDTDGSCTSESSQNFSELTKEESTSDKPTSPPVRPVRPRVCPFLLQPEIDEMIAKERGELVTSSVLRCGQSNLSDTYELPSATSASILEAATREYPPRFGSVDAALNPEVVKFDEDKKTMLMKRAQAKIDSLKRKLGLKSNPVAPKKYLIFLGIYSSLVENPPIIHPEVRVQFFLPGHKTFNVSPDAVVQCHFPSVYENIRTLRGSYFPEYLNSFLFDHHALHVKSPGKTDSDFYFTADRKYVIKTIQRKEHNTLMGESFMKDYYSHIQENPESLIPTYLGHFTLRTLGKDTHFVVMKNLVGTDVDTVYDLKGIKHRKRSEATSAMNGRDINKDGDWVENQEIIFMGKDKRKKLLTQLASDVALLEKYNIMEYSLLVGIHKDPQSSEIRHAMGMIDSLSPYGVSKALKSNISRIVHHHSSLNIINPRDYGKRFLNFIGSTVVLERGRPMTY